MQGTELDKLAFGLEQVLPLSKLKVSGRVIDVSPSQARIEGLSHFLKLGDCVWLETPDGAQMAEAVRLDRDTAIVKPFDPALKGGAGARAWIGEPFTLNPHPEWKGRVINALGQPLDEVGVLPQGEETWPFDRLPPQALRRQRVEKPITTGVRVIDLFSPFCAGQRIGIFAGSGVGKSTLLAMLAQSADFDTAVISLVGERGREVREFLEDVLGERRNKSVAVISTSDESPMMRRLAPRTALTIAEYFRARRENVLLIIDSVTRYAHAARDVALAAGEPPVSRGYPPSVFSDLPKLLERAGPGEEGEGTITGIFSVLVDGDDHNDPVADNLRGTLDGHIVLDRAIADQGRYPAVDILGSISRLATKVWSPEQRVLITDLRARVARFEETRDIRLLGGYKPGTDLDLDLTVEVVPKLYHALTQTPHHAPSLDAFREIAQLLAHNRGGG